MCVRVCVRIVRQCSIQSFYLNKDKLNWVTGTDSFLIYSLLYIYLYPTGVVYFTSYIIVIFSNIYIYFAIILFATCNVPTLMPQRLEEREKTYHGIGV